jgi:cobalamin biosynthesis protein CobT
MSKLSTLDMWSVTKYVRAVANEAGLTITWEDKFQPRTDGKTIWLPRVNSNMTQKLADQLMYSADHECSHVIYSKFDGRDGLTAQESFLGAIVNGLEDNRIDYKTGSLYEGSRIIGDGVVSSTIQDVQKELEKHLKDAATNPELKKNMEGVSSLVAWLAEAREHYYPLTALTGRDMRPTVEKISKDAIKYIDKLNAGDYAEKLKEISYEELSKAEAYEKILALAERIYEEVYEQDAEKEKERCKQKAQKQKGGSGEGEDQSGSEADEGDGEQASAKASGEGDQQAEDGKEGKPSKKFQNVKWTKFVQDNHDKSKLHAPLEGQHIDYSDYRAGLRSAYVPSLETTSVIDYRSRTATNVPDSVSSRLLNTTSNHNDYKSSIARQLSKHASTEGFANKVRQLLQIRAKARTQYGVKSGKLHAGNINRVTLKNAGAYADRIFKKKEEKDLLNISITIVCDMSGSMGGQKLVNAAVASMLLNHTLGNILHIPIEMVGFSELGRDNLMYVWRNFGDKLVSNDDLINSIVASSQNMRGNQDGEAVLFAYERIKKQKTKRKLLIVLSDGSPACSKDGDDVEFLERTVKSIEKSSTEIIGIGICDDNVKQFYKENYVIQDSSELERALLSLIDKKLTT